MDDPKAFQKFGFLLLPDFPMACLTSAIEPLRAANEICGTEAFSWTLISEDGANVNSSANVAFNPESSLADCDDLDAIFILSSPQGAFANASGTNGKLRHLARHGIIIGAVSGGVFPLAHAGLLDGHRVSVHWCYKTAFQSQFPTLDTSDDVIVMDRRIYTASGAAAAFDVMLNLIENSLGDRVMTEVACWFQHPVVRSEGVLQKIPAFRSDTTANELPEPVTKAIALFSEHLEFPISIHDVCKEIGISPKSLERSFKAAVEVSPGKYYRILRLRAARQLVMYSNETFTDIAQSVGYSGSSTLAQNYRWCFGTTPQEERKRLNGFRVRDNRPLPSVPPKLNGSED